MNSRPLVVVRSAYSNAGDHLISEAVSRQLDLAGLSYEVLSRPERWDTSSRKQFQQKFRDSSAICLAGGPLLREDLIDGFLANTLGDDFNKVFFYGVGRSGGVNRLGRVNFSNPGKISFSRETALALRKIMTNGLFHSARDSITKEILNRFSDQEHWVHNTGCPVRQASSWPKQVLPSSAEGVRRVLFTAPAREHRAALTLARRLVRNFADARVLFQSGLDSPDPSNFSVKDRIVRSPSLLLVNDFNLELMKVFEPSATRDAHAEKIVNAKGDSELLKKAVEWADLVIGYRVHAHLYALSQNKKSLLIAEDLRGYGQNLNVVDGSESHGGRGQSSPREVLTIRTPVSRVWRDLASMSNSQFTDWKLSASPSQSMEGHGSFVKQRFSANLAKLGL